MCIFIYLNSLLVLKQKKGISYTSNTIKIIIKIDKENYWSNSVRTKIPVRINNYVCISVIF